jgi:hypothetical protein
MAQSQAYGVVETSAMSTRVTTRVVPQSVSLAGSVLAVLPAVYGASLILPVAGLDWNPVEYGIIAVAFYLASVALAAIDERQLRRLGVARAATAFWSLLTPMPYLVARTRALVTAGRPGLALLWTAISASTLSLLALAAIALR